MSVPCANPCRSVKFLFSLIALPKFLPPSIFMMKRCPVISYSIQITIRACICHPSNDSLLGYHIAFQTIPPPSQPPSHPDIKGRSTVRYCTGYAMCASMLLGSDDVSSCLYSSLYIHFVRFVSFRKSPVKTISIYGIYLWV